VSTARGWPCTVVDEFEMESAIAHMLHPSSPGSHTLLVARGAEFHGSDEPHKHTHLTLHWRVWKERLDYLEEIIVR
jgi:hypothetical protein